MPLIIDNIFSFAINFILLMKISTADLTVGNDFARIY
jgi:hypothetical protein